MRFQLVVFVVATSAFVLGEIPPSNSYLPPSSQANRNAGYPQGPQLRPSFPEAPQVNAARTLGQAGRGQGNAFSRSSTPDNAIPGRLEARAGLGYDENSAIYGINEIDSKSEPAHYNFGYMVADYDGSDFGHHEERLKERAQGEYHVVLPDGRKQTVSYEADERGFQPQVSYKDTEDLTRSGGYDGVANTRSHGNGYQNGRHEDTSAY